MKLINVFLAVGLTSAATLPVAASSLDTSKLTTKLTKSSKNKLRCFKVSGRFRRPVKCPKLKAVKGPHISTFDNIVVVFEDKEIPFKQYYQSQLNLQKLQLDKKSNTLSGNEQLKLLEALDIDKKQLQQRLQQFQAPSQ